MCRRLLRGEPRQPQGGIVEVDEELAPLERFELWVMREIEKGTPLPGLYPPNAETRARYEEEKGKA